MVEDSHQEQLFPENPPDPGVVVINDRCAVRSDGVHRVVVVGGLPMASYRVGDRMAEAYAIVSLVERGYADQNDVARAFQVTARTVPPV